LLSIDLSLATAAAVDAIDLLLLLLLKTRSICLAAAAVDAIDLSCCYRPISACCC
jgi:hypothetical protein